MSTCIRHLDTHLNTHQTCPDSHPGTQKHPNTSGHSTDIWTYLDTNPEITCRLGCSSGHLATNLHVWTPVRPPIKCP